MIEEDVKPAKEPSTKALMAAAIFGDLFGKIRQVTGKLTTQRKCLKCGTVHRHSNSFCCAEHCRTWRLENPLKGRGNHHFGKLNQAYRTNPEGYEELLS